MTVFLLDADLFLTVACEVPEKELQEVPIGTLAAWRPKTYAPLGDVDE